MSRKNSMIFNQEWADHILTWEPERALEFTTALLEYSFYDEDHEFDNQRIQQIFDRAKSEIDENNDKWAAKVESANKAREKRANLKSELKSELKSNLKSELKSELKSSGVDVNVYVNDNVSPTETNINPLSEDSSDRSDTTGDFQQIMDAWNALSEYGIAKISRITSNTDRGKWTKSRLNEYSLDDILKAIDQVKQSDFLQGKANGKFIITYDWFIRPNNFIKVLDGNYTGNARAKPTSGSAYIDAINNRIDAVDGWLERRGDDSS